MKERMGSVSVSMEGNEVVLRQKSLRARLEVIDDLEGITRQNKDNIFRVVEDDLFDDPNAEWINPIEEDRFDESHFGARADARLKRIAEGKNNPRISPSKEVRPESHLTDDLAKLRRGERGRGRRAFRVVDDTHYMAQDDRSDSLDIFGSFEDEDDSDELDVFGGYEDEYTY